jgi:hypothetical protein
VNARARAVAWACGMLLLTALGACSGEEPMIAASSPHTRERCARPYADDSPWNRPVAKVQGRPAGLDDGSPLTSDPSQYTYPVYEVTRRTPLRTVRFDGWYSRVVAGGTRLKNVRGGSDQVARVPIPARAMAAAGSDAQIIVVNRDTGEEWDMSNVTRASDGTFDVSNIGRYVTKWSAVPPQDDNFKPYFLRGAKIPYLAGLVRPCEIRRGRISHALAFAYPATTSQWVYPATHSDGRRPVDAGLPMGTRLQLDPSIGAETITQRWGCTGPCLTVARALQRYGMYLIDTSGRPKLMMEYDATADWKGMVTASTPSAIPVEHLRIVPPPRRSG